MVDVSIKCLSSNARTLNETNLHSYKMIPTQEFMKIDFDRKTCFCEHMIAMLDDNMIQLQHVLFSNEYTSRSC